MKNEEIKMRLDMPLIKSLTIGGFLLVNRPFLEIIGKDAALLLGELVAEDNFHNTEIFTTNRNYLMKKTGLSKNDLVDALGKLREIGFIKAKTEWKGLPTPRITFFLYKEKINRVLFKALDISYK